MPNLYIIAGCNGAGKTTASYTVLPEILGCKEFVNADEIAKGLSPFQPEKVAIQAGRIMLQRIDELLKLEEDFAFETTLTTRSYQQTIKFAKEKGYTVTLVFFWLNDVNLAIERVKARVAEGGHDIPEETIIRRYKKGLRNLVNIFIDISDYWLVVDNTQNPFQLIAQGDFKNNTKVYQQQSWDKIKLRTNATG